MGAAQEGGKEASMEETEGQIVKELEQIAFGREGERTADKLRALELLSKLLGLFSEKEGKAYGEVTILDDLPRR